MSKIKKVLFIGLIFFAVVFSTYQMFMAPTEAGFLKCGDQPCLQPGGDCGATLPCSCVQLFGVGPLKCYFGAVVE
jgi:hypothetical protein